MKTLEQLAGWLLFSLSILMVYGFLSLFVIGPAHAGWDLYGFDGTMFYKSYDSLAACEQDRPKIEGLSECRDAPRPNHDATTTHYYQHCSPTGCDLYKSKATCERAAHCTKEEFRGPMPTKD